MLQSITLIIVAGAALIMAAVILMRIMPLGSDQASGGAAGRAAGDQASEPERKSVETDAAQRDAEWYRHLFRSTGDMVFVHGLTEEGAPGRFSEVNDLACARLGYSRSRLLGMTPLEIADSPPPATLRGFTRVELATLPDEEIAGRRRRMEAQALMRRILEETRVSYDSVLLTRTGEKIPVEIDARRIDALPEPMILSIARDVSARRAAERALRESQQRSRDFFAHSPLGVAVYDASRRLLNVNSACLKMFGCPGQSEFARFDPFTNPFLPEPARKRVAEGETVRQEIDMDFEQARGMGALVTTRGGHANLDMVIINLGLDSEFRSKGYLLQVQDVTERRRAEEALRENEKQLRQAQKMQAIGTLAGGIAHDFNNILTPILGYAEMCLYAPPSSENLSNYLTEILKAGNRAKDLVNQILTFSRQIGPEGRPIRVTPILKEVLVLMRGSLPQNIEIRHHIKAENDVIMANSTQIHQIMMNLCANAGYAMRPTGGTLDVWLTEFVLEPRAGSRFPQLDPGRYLRISVKDSGPGMEAELVERIFEPFFTTKPSGEGTGMGLAVVHGIAMALKGAVAVDTAPGQGATFHVVLPLMERPAGEPPPARGELSTGSGCVLFVDDDADVARMASRMLATLGYQPLVAGGAEEALRLFKDNPGRFVAVVTDQVMPHKTGAEMAGEMLAVRPDVPIILCTGYGQTVSPRDAAAAGVRELLAKPLIMRDLAETLRRHIGRPAAESAESGSDPA
ncbi:MAG: PAS domain S-box protein [Lentisphaerae bacterium]|nr:PAS domain S-box protein [Lentisphaerota bacterium]